MSLKQYITIIIASFLVVCLILWYMYYNSQFLHQAIYVAGGLVLLLVVATLTGKVGVYAGNRASYKLGYNLYVLAAVLIILVTQYYVSQHIMLNRITIIHWVFMCEACLCYFLPGPTKR